MLFALFPIPQPTTPGSPSSKAILVSLSLLYVLPAIWGIATSIGLFRLKQWSRISIIIFSVILIFMGLCGALSMLVIPAFPPQATSHDLLTTIDWLMAVFASIFTGIGVWWMVFFNRGTVKAQFAPSSASTIPAGETAAHAEMHNGGTSARVKRPLSITVIAWLLFVSCLFLVPSIAMHYPAILFRTLLNGWSASLIYFCFALVHLYVGIGLLRLNPKARLVAIAYFVFAFLSSTTFSLAPGGTERFLRLLKAQQAIFPTLVPPQPALAPVVNFRFLAASSGVGAIVLFVALYFLVTAKKSFMDADAHSALTS